MNKLRKIAPMWVGQECPTDKLLAQGATTLANDELLSLVMGVETVVARGLLESVGHSLMELGRATPAQLSLLDGVTASRAVRLSAAMELGRREQSEKVEKQVRIVGSVDIVALFEPIMRSLAYEEVWLVMLSNSKNIIEKVRLSSGGTVNSPIDIKLVLKNAVQHLACGVVVVHNHPSGNCAPSQYDIDITRRLKNALEIIDVRLLDHIIIGRGDSFSFAERGLI